MILYDKAISIVTAHARTKNLKTQEVGVEESIGRIAAEDCLSPVLNPMFDNSSMDGFAVSSSETLQATPEKRIRFEVLKKIAAGDESESISHRSFSCVEIMTGAPLPKRPFDAVIKIEDVELERDQKGRISAVLIKNPVKPREFVREAGEDFKIGDVVLKKGEVIHERHILALATLGISSVRVFDRPRVAVISTGKELVSYQVKKISGVQVRNSTLPYLAHSLKNEYGCEIVHASVVGDSRDEFRNEMTKALEAGVDFIVTTGAVSMGSEDYIPKIIAEMGAKTHYHKTAIRPGKPGLFASFGEKGPCVFGVPGNPLSTVVALRFFINPYLRTLREMAEEKPLKARLLLKTVKPEGLRCFFKANLMMRNSEVTVDVHTGQPSFMVRPLLESNAWVIFEEEGTSVLENSVVNVYPLSTQGFDFSFENLELSRKDLKSGCCS